VAVQILEGDVFDRLSDLPDEHVHCAVFSPPYWGLRDYGIDGQIGLEPTLGEHIETMVRVFREIRRVLRKDGTVWLNYGDAYAGSGKGVPNNEFEGGRNRSDSQVVGRTPAGTLKPKDLMMMPARVALALQADGWWLRSEIVWHKPNPMPENVTDRPTCAHEKVFLLAKSGRYFYDAQAVRTPMAASSVQRLSQPTFDQQTGGPKDPKSGNRSHRKVLENPKARRVPAGWASSPDYDNQDPRYPKRDKQWGHSRRHAGFNDRWDAMSREEQQANGANLRNVWTIPIAPFSGGHFATFPTALVEPCIKAGTSEKGCCPECGAPWVRVSETDHINPGNRSTNGPRSRERRHETAGFAQRLERSTSTVGWVPSCDCGAADPVPCTVLDPFAGAGAVGLVAARLGRDAILIELNPEYADMARERINGDAPLLTEVA